jgi:hypothetical protein
MDDLKQRLNDLAYGTGSKAPQDAIARIEQTKAKLAKAVVMLKTMADYNKYVIAPLLAELEGKE